MCVDKKQELMLFASGHIYRETGTSSKFIKDKEFTPDTKLGGKKVVPVEN